MNRYKLYLTIILLAIISIEVTNAQQFTLGISSGIAGFSMKDLREFNTLYIKSQPVDARLTDDFPAQPFYTLFLNYKGGTPYYFGAGLHYTTTGSRVSYKDYSGILQYDNILTVLAPSLRAGIILHDKKISIAGENDLNYAFSTLKVYETILAQDGQYHYRSRSIQAEPGIRISLPAGRFSLSLKAGYLIDGKGKNILKEDSEVYLKTSSGKAVRTDWSGFRLGLSAGFDL